MLVAGVDEAGRGCVIGPLVVAGVLVSEERLSDLVALGVKDSKLLSQKKRAALFQEITKIVSVFKIVKVSPFEIDKAVNCQIPLHKLNRLEAKTMAQIIEHLHPDEVYVDAADILEERFATHISECLSFKPKIISRHKADQLYPVVSAASILAKVERDLEIELLKNEFGDIGTGYLHDEKTKTFLTEWLKTNKNYPPCVRKSWKPAKKALSERNTTQQKLF
ncbi:MAG: ribonuclease HII [Candidatus Bathyarchaeota archaeon]|nr:ribonuclease HII [Candidatus Termiticorpusculum sp.]MCL2868839.1 ribonuclease HII [Candidatus Termiticorpusculum sp.]